MNTKSGIFTREFATREKIVLCSSGEIKVGLMLKKSNIPYILSSMSAPSVHFTSQVSLCSIINCFPMLLTSIHNYIIRVPVPELYAFQYWGRLFKTNDIVS